MSSHRNDPSMRFFKYIMNRYGDVKSYFDLDKYPTVEEYLPRICQLGCFSKIHLQESLNKTNLGPHPLKIKLDKKLSKRKVLVPQFTSAERDTIQKLLDDDSVKFLVFPMILLEGTNPKCIPSKMGSKLKHMILIAFNKARSELEIWDDRMARVQKRFDYEDLSDHVIKYFGPVLKTFDKNGKPIRTKSCDIPIFQEEHYPLIREVLMQSDLQYNYGAIYTAFLCSYIYLREEDPNAEMDEMVVRAAPTEDVMSMALFMELYSGLLQHNEDFVNLSEYTSLSAHSSLLSEKSPCPSKQMRNPKTGECEDLPEGTSVTVPKHYRICNDKVDNLVAYYKYILMYFLTKHPNMATIVPKENWEAHPYYYAIRWELEQRIDKNGNLYERFQLYYPDVLDDFMHKTLDDSSKRFIVLILGISGRSESVKHANALVIDTNNMTVERYEPNQGYWERDFEDVVSTRDPRFENGTKLDRALETLFQSYGLSYINPDTICPIGLHRHNWRSVSGMVEEIGGHCLTWTTFYIDLRLSNPDLDSCTLHQYALDEIRREGSFQHFINGYNAFMIRTANKFRGWRSLTFPSGITLKPFPGTTAAKRRATQQKS